MIGRRWRVFRDERWWHAQCPAAHHFPCGCYWFTNQPEALAYADRMARAER